MDTKDNQFRIKQQKIKQRRKQKAKSRRMRLILSTVFCIIVALIIGNTVHNINIKAKYKAEKIAKEEAENAKKAAEKKAQEELQAKLNHRAEDFAVDSSKSAGGEATDEKIVYLTFDDGPSKLTEQVLDILDQYDAKATFFVIAHNLDYAYMIKEAYDRGHTIGMHTYSHDYQKVYASTDAYFEDLDAISQVVKEQIGYVPCFIRFPGGSSNTVSKFNPGIMTKLTEEVQNRGYQYYDWNCSSGDGSVTTTENIIQSATSGDMHNIILLFHDSAAKQTTVDALPSVLEYYKNQGYTFKALDRQTITAHHPINN